MLGQYDTVEGRINTYKEALKNAQPVGKFVNDKVVVSSIGFCDENKQRTRSGVPRLLPGILTSAYVTTSVAGLV